MTIRMYWLGKVCDVIGEMQDRALGWKGEGEVKGRTGRAWVRERAV